VYSGADGDFILYEDEGDTYNCEKGNYTIIPMHWNDSAHRLTIGERKGSFPKMLVRRRFDVILVGENHGGGIEASPAPDRVIEYSGREVTVAHQDR